jgi:hypothetical protein
MSILPVKSNGRVLYCVWWCGNMAGAIASSLHVWPVGRGEVAALIRTALYELDETGLQCSIALPLGVGGRQERLS